MIFDFKMGENFRRETSVVTRGHRKTTPKSLTCSSAVSRESVRISLPIDSLGGFSVLALCVQSACLTAPYREKIHVNDVPEFGSDAGKIMIAIRALCGFK